MTRRFRKPSSDDQVTDLGRLLGKAVQDLHDYAGPELSEKFWLALKHERSSVNRMWHDYMDEIVEKPSAARAAWLKDMPNPRDRGRGETWGETHYNRIDHYADQGHTPTTAAKMIAREDGLNLTGEALKNFADARVKAWHKSSPERARRK